MGGVQGRRREVRMVMMGVDGAGKATIIHKLKLGEVITVMPTLGVVLHSVSYRNNFHITWWDVGGRSKVRPLWRHYYKDCDALIFVVDSADPDEMEMARRELHDVLAEDLMEGVPLLVWANKQDLPSAASTLQLADRLGLHDIRGGRQWYIQGSDATSGVGLYEGLDWLSDAVASRQESTGAVGAGAGTQELTVKYLNKAWSWLKQSITRSS